MVEIPIEILLVDDEWEFCEALAERLLVRGHRTRTASDGETALKALDEGPCDVVLLDLVMPGLSGIATLREIKSRHPLIEVIVLTGHGSVESAVEGLKSGAFDYIIKPPKHDELLEKLAAARQRKAEQEERIRQAQVRTLTRRTGDV